MVVAEVESGNGGFSKDGTPVVRFEGGYFRRYYREHHLAEPEGYQELFYNYSKQTEKNKPHGREIFNKALSLNKDAAIYSTSFGFGQVMGANYKAGGFKDLDEFYQSQYNMDGQIRAFTGFLRSKPSLIQALEHSDFTAFAEGYNGAEYYNHDYDKKMQKLYDELKKANH